MVSFLLILQFGVPLSVYKLYSTVILCIMHKTYFINRSYDGTCVRRSMILGWILLDFEFQVPIVNQTESERFGFRVIFFQYLTYRFPSFMMTKI